MNTDHYSHFYSKNSNLCWCSLVEQLLTIWYRRSSIIFGVCEINFEFLFISQGVSIFVFGEESPQFRMFQAFQTKCKDFFLLFSVSMFSDQIFLEHRRNCYDYPPILLWGRWIVFFRLPSLVFWSESCGTRRLRIQLCFLWKVRTFLEDPWCLLQHI